MVPQAFTPSWVNSQKSWWTLVSAPGSAEQVSCQGCFSKQTAASALLHLLAAPFLAAAFAPFLAAAFAPCCFRGLPVIWVLEACYIQRAARIELLHFLAALFLAVALAPCCFLAAVLGFLVSVFFSAAFFLGAAFFFCTPASLALVAFPAACSGYVIAEGPLAESMRACWEHATCPPRTCRNT